MPLQNSLKLILLLSTDDAYIEGCKELIKSLHKKTYREINPVAYKAGGVFWVHISHPSTENGWHNKWVKDPPNTTSGRKRELAQKVVTHAMA